MNELIKITVNENQEQIISGRELHKFLEVKEKYTQWFSRMVEYGFIENTDFILVVEKKETNNPKNPYTKYIDHAIKIGMAKEIAMIQRNEKGKQARLYFIEVEKQYKQVLQYKTPQTMVEALTLALEQAKRIESLEAENKNQSLQLIEQTPKVEYYDTLVEKELLLGVRDSAKELEIPQNIFVRTLLACKYIYRDKSKQLRPYAKYTPRLFKMKEYVNEKGYTGTQMLITVEGRNELRKLFEQ